MFKKKILRENKQMDHLSTSHPLEKFSSPEHDILEGGCLERCDIRSQIETCSKSCELEFGHTGAHLCPDGHHWR